MAWNRRVWRHWSAFFIDVPLIKFVPVINIDRLHIARTPADVQALQREVGSEQESLGALECIFHFCTTKKVCSYVEYGSIAHSMDPRRRLGSSGRGWLGTRESGSAGVHFSLMYHK